MRESVLRAALFGAALSSGSLMILGHGLLGLGPIFSGLTIAIPIAGLVALTPWRAFRPNLCDGLFAAFACAVAVSHLVNGAGHNLKEGALLATTFALYLAGRVTSGREARAGVIVVGAGVTAAAVIATLVALLGQWSDRHGKPLVFGEYDAAPLQFAALFGLMMLATAATNKLDRWVIVAVGALVALSSAVFAASMVRFSLLAIVLAASVGVLLGGSEGRRHRITLILTLMVGIVAGVVARWDMASIYTTHLVTATNAMPVPSVPSGAAVPSVPSGAAGPPLQERELCPEIDLDNSLAIRKQLLIEALHLLPRAGLFGIGPGEFSAHSCIKGHEIHNSLLQVFVEFGWLAGFLLLALLAAAWRSVKGLADTIVEYRFAACALFYVVLLSMVYGLISRDGMLMLVVGLAGHLRATRGKTAEDWMLRAMTVAPLKTVATSPDARGS